MVKATIVETTTNGVPTGYAMTINPTGSHWGGTYVARQPVGPTGMDDTKPELVQRVKEFWPEIARQRGAMTELRSLPKLALLIMVNQL